MSLEGDHSAKKFRKLDNNLLTEDESPSALVVESFGDHS